MPLVRLIKLVNPISAQAVTDHARRIRFVVDPDRQWVEIPTEEEWQRKQEHDEWAKKVGIPDLENGPDSLPLWVDFEMSDGWRVAMTCPGNLEASIIRRLKVRFNLQRFTTLEEPENLIYLEGCFLTLESYAPNERTRAIVGIETEYV